jgi:hypothetical protein
VPLSVIPLVTLLQFTELMLLVFCCNVQPVDGRATFGGLGRYRRLNRDYERQAKIGQTMVYVAMIRLVLARLARNG